MDPLCTMTQPREIASFLGNFVFSGPKNGACLLVPRLNLAFH